MKNNKLFLILGFLAIFLLLGFLGKSYLPSNISDSTNIVDSNINEGNKITDVINTKNALDSAKWSDNVSITVTSDSFNYISDGIPNHELPDQFIVPADGNRPPFNNDDPGDFNIVDTVDLIKETPIDVDITLNPKYSETITRTSLGQIGVMISGAQLFNDYEDMQLSSVALDDNLTMDGASFVDSCSGHPLQEGTNYHYHGVPFCITDNVDITGEHSTVIGFLLDGFPVYGNKDVEGIEITNASLDECSGHFGPTPEFPEGIYHYHLTADEAPYSIDCFHGEIEYTRGGGGRGPGGNGGPAGGPPAGGPPQGGQGRPTGPPANGN